MAYLDNAEAQRLQKQKENYESLKQEIRGAGKMDTSDLLFHEYLAYVQNKPKHLAGSVSKLSPYIPALQHMEAMELELREAKEKIKMYQNFFTTLRNLLPEEYNLHTPLH